MDLVHEMTYHALLRPPLVIGDGPSGTRMKRLRRRCEAGDELDRSSRSLRDSKPGRAFGWLNQSVFVGEGRLYPGFGSYRVDRVL